ncbi:secretion stress-responsive two-component system response regulator CssR [Bacillus spizizenii]|uniref:Secretion stress-responsive two-component system response regulator CssR n=4 Tax=Bacillus TaxID=1386 RepID=A0A9Q4E6B2_BACSC|nr:MULTISPECIES: secretion stress-responsive two-component system response regulator CssR [Bacillus]APH66122.1 DNA-binding response regulator [Bacillus subtilis]AUZ27806.1 DNA-binding response regulator [Bacillus cereus]KFI03010.1 transcriptional regulator [Bacillus sp. BSC154]OLQ49140.1 DNA-binding response regulator [Bacillus licheniformis]ADM39264.1 two-component response regulator [Bacillus spizizenii str. W23]
MSYTIYLVEDEDNLNELLTKYLENEGWNITSFTKGEDARKKMTPSPHLWILDIMLPDTDGYTLIKEIKAKDPDVPVIFISARDADIDRVLGLELGSNDYISKPFLPRELIIRVQKLLQLVYKEAPPVQKNEIAVSSYRVAEDAREVYDENGNIINLTSKEFDLLLLFIHHKGHPYSREDILVKVWGHDYFGTDRVVDDLVRRLRKKMPELKVETIYGFGYRMMTS